VRVGVSNPFCWPEVRRGGERLQQDLCSLYRDAGHDVTLIASVPEGGAPEHPGGVAAAGLSRGRMLPPLHDFACRVRGHVGGQDYDCLHALTHFDAGAALTLRRRPRILAQSIGAPTMRMFRRRPVERWLLHRTMRRADTVAVLSRYAHDRLATDLDRRIHVLPPMVDLAQFTPGPRGGAPDLLFVGDVTEPRKNAALVLAAFARIAAERPELRLGFSGHVTPEVRASLLRGLEPRLAERVDFLGTGARADLPRLYAGASAVILPAAFEAFGLVLVEALASGTPVVGATPGGAADIVDSPEIGALIDLAEADLPRVLADAMRHALDLSGDPATPARCRSRAERFGHDALGPRYLELLAGTA
jgi:phosphatidylinositol alpha-mannosyltransferase